MGGRGEQEVLGANYCRVPDNGGREMEQSGQVQGEF